MFVTAHRFWASSCLSRHNRPQSQPKSGNSATKHGNVYNQSIELKTLNMISDNKNNQEIMRERKKELFKK